MHTKFANNQDLIAGSPIHYQQSFEILLVNEIKKRIAGSPGNFSYTHCNPNHSSGDFLTTHFGVAGIKTILTGYECLFTEMKPYQGKHFITAERYQGYKNQVKKRFSDY